MIEVHGLRKEFGDTVAVDGASFTAESGAIFGLLGPNGAGKSTTIGCISGRLALHWGLAMKRLPNNSSIPDKTTRSVPACFP